MRSTTARAVLATGLLAGLATVAVCGAGASYASTRAGAVKVTGTADNKFDPSTVDATLDASGKVTIDFSAVGAPHTMQSDEVAFNSGNVNAGETKTMTFAAKPGTYAFYCLYHKSLGMTGTLTVSAAGGASSAPATATSSATPSATESATPTATASVFLPTPNPSATVQPGIDNNSELALLKSERDAQHGAVSGFRFFTMVGIAFVVILSAAVLVSTRPRRAGR